MTAGLSWTRGVKKDVYAFTRVGAQLVEIARSEKRIGSRRRAGWHKAWFYRVDEGPWIGDVSRPTSEVASIAEDKRLGFTTMRRAKAAAIGAVS